MKIKLSTYAKMSGVSVRTLWRRIAEGTLSVERSETGRVFVNIEENPIKEHYTVIYSRVSSSENKSNLISQTKRCKDFCAANGWVIHEVIEEIGSGLNDERRRLQKMFKNDKITRVIVEHKDRLTRFGFNFLTSLWNVEIVVINNIDNDEKDLMQDFVSLVTSFTARLYGRRRSKRLTEKIINDLNEKNEIG
jgi:putative resolvase